MTPSMLISLTSLFPFESTLHPLVDKTHHENGQEHHHGNKAKQADFLEHHGPGEEKGDFEIKQDKEDGDEVIAHIEFHASILEGFEAAFVWGVFFAVRLIGSNQ